MDEDDDFIEKRRKKLKELLSDSDDDKPVRVEKKKAKDEDEEIYVETHFPQRTTSFKKQNLTPTESLPVDKERRSVQDITVKFNKQIEELTEEKEKFERLYLKEKELNEKERKSMESVGSKKEDNDIKSLQRKIRMLEGENKDLKEDIEHMKGQEKKTSTTKSFEQQKLEAEQKRERLKQERDEKYGNKILSKEFEDQKKELEKTLREENEKKLAPLENKIEKLTKENKQLQERNKERDQEEELLMNKLEKIKGQKNEAEEKKKELEIDVKHFERDLKEKEEEIKLLKEKQEEMKEAMEKLKKDLELLTNENEELKKRPQMPEGYDQLNQKSQLGKNGFPPPPPLNVPKNSVYPQSKGYGGIGDLLNAIKKGHQLRKTGGIEGKDFTMPIEVSIAEECMKMRDQLKKTK